MSRDPLLYLEDIRASCRKILQFTAGMAREHFLQDDRTYDAVIRNLEIIGEAARNVPEELQQRHPSIQWREMTALRIILAHIYFGINDDIIWDVVQNKIPDLLQKIESVLGEIGG